MTVSIDPGCGDSTYTSTLYSVTANGVSTHCYGASRVTEFAVPGYWAEAESVEVSCARVMADESVTFAVTLISGAITSYRIFPKRLYGNNASIVGGKVVVTLPVGAKACVVANGVRKNRCYLAVDELIEPPDEGDPLVDIYDGTQVAALSGRTLVFQAGVTNIFDDAWGAKLFPVEDEATVYLAQGAWVIGSFNYHLSPTTMATNVRFYGSGNLSGEWTDPETVDALPGGFDEQITYALIYGRISGVGGVNNRVEGITLWTQPFHSTGAAVLNEIRNVGIFAPWNDHCDGFKAWSGGGDGDTFIIEDNFCWVGDDAVVVESWMRDGVVRNNLLSTSGSSVLNFGYQQDYADLGFTQTCTDNYSIECLDYYLDVNGTNGGAQIAMWVDAYEGQTTIGRYGVVVDGFHVEGDQCYSQLFSIGNRQYPTAFGDGVSRDAAGNVAGCTFKNITCESVPVEPSHIRALDHQNAAHDHDFDHVRIGGDPLDDTSGLLVTVRNYSDYFTLYPYAYDIRFGGRAVTTQVDICNMALAHIGNKAKVTAINPADGSVEAAHCERFLPMAVNALLDMHPWSWATAKIELTAINVDGDGEQTDNDDEAWEWRYEIPNGMVRAISVIPDDSTNDYLVAGQKIPVDFCIKRSSEDEELRIYTNQEDAFLRYIVYEDDTNVWDPLFVMALSWHLASLLAGPIVKGEQGHAEAQRCLQRMSQYLAEAKQKDSNERQATVERRASWLRGR